MRGRLSYTVAAVAVLGVVAAAVVSGQNQRGLATMDDLLAELRGLRADINNAAAASMRLQSLIARLSLQEQRINTLGRQVTDVNAQLETVTRERINHEDHLKQFESAIADGTLPQALRREDAEAEVASQRRSLSQIRAREAQLRNQAAAVAGLIATEQNRWSDFNGRLDDLERSLESDASGRR